MRAIRLEPRGAVGTIVIDRPEARNAVDGPAARALAAAFRELEPDDALRAGVLWGAGGVFSARLALTKPTVAAVEGDAVAGGRELSLTSAWPARLRAGGREPPCLAPRRRVCYGRATMPGVSVESVGKRFGTVRAVDGVSLVVPDGRLLTLLGPSGCGKTTTLRMIAGLEHTDSGRISIGDRVVSDPAAGVFVAPERREIGMVFQSYAIWPHMTVFANVAYPLEVRRRPAAEVRERVQGALRLMEMEHLATRPATALSGGQQQRVAIARALVFQPRVLLMDEPLSNLDAKLREQMRVELRALQQRLGITTIYVTHDQEEAMVLSDEIAMMHEGRVLQVAAPETIYTRPASRTVAAFFGSPNLLAAKAREVRRAPGGSLARLEGSGWEGWCRVPAEVQPGEVLTLVARPEVIQLGGPAPTSGIAWRGIVRQRFFRGTRNLYTIEAGGQRLSVDAPPEKTLAAGAEVTLGLDAEHTWAVRE